MRHVGSVKQLATLCMGEVITGMTVGESTDHVELMVSTESGQQFLLQLPMVGPRANMFVAGVFDALRDPVRRVDLAAGDLSAIMPIHAPKPSPRWEYATTEGSLRWDSTATQTIGVDDPKSPDGDGWEMCGSVMGALRYSDQPILWFWRRKVT